MSGENCISTSGRPDTVLHITLHRLSNHDRESQCMNLSSAVSRTHLSKCTVESRVPKLFTLYHKIFWIISCFQICENRFLHLCPSVQSKVNKDVDERVACGRTWVRCTNVPIINLIDLEIVSLAFSSNIVINTFIKACILLNFIIGF